MGTRWNERERERFAATAAATNDIGGVARRANVQPGTVEEWIREFGYTRAGAAGTGASDAAAASQATTQAVGAAVSDGGGLSSAEHELLEVGADRVAEACWNRWISAQEAREDPEANEYLSNMHSMRTLWSAICKAGDEQNHDSPYKAFMQSYITDWAEEVIGSEFDDDPEYYDSEGYFDYPDTVEDDEEYEWRERIGSRAREKTVALILGKVRAPYWQA